ncbi:uncharacterized protein TRAVEDRAFT_124712, partial [Trametes versicolor FP-101664 SS1]|uniref:uncharacterized protein n=1 Tax=Trametes versicolor (strain FP-101664) TaxID=717944 RepID=UPI0004621E5A
LKGASLARLTQRLAYKGVRLRSARPERRATGIVLGRIQATLEDDYKLHPTSKSLWKNIRKPEVAKRTRDFLWKCMHDAYKLGTYWNNIPGYEARGICAKCEVPETMEHVLAECDAPGRGLLWALATNMLRGKRVEHPPLTFGAMIAGPSLSMEGLTGRKNQGADRLLRIVVAETAHLIWKVRCERVIERENTVERWHTQKELRLRWLAAMNLRLKRDIALTHKRWKKARLPRELVLATWAGTLQDEKDLPDDWIDEQEVLVGMSPCTSRLSGHVPVPD